MKTETELNAFKAKLLSVLTAYDRKQLEAASRRPRGYHNPNALGIYFARADEVCADVARGADPRAAICAAFTDRLLSAVLRGMAMAAPSDAECRGEGQGLFYRPVMAEGAS